MDCCCFVQFWCLQNLITAVSRVSRQVEALVEQHLQLKQELRGLAELRHQNRQLTDKVCYYARASVCLLCIACKPSRQRKLSTQVGCCSTLQPQGGPARCGARG